jgi:hypothetical protein
MPDHEQEKWEVLPAGAMREKYGLYAENRPIIKLNPEDVPERLRPLIPYAEHFGVNDDLMRADLLAKTSAQELEGLRRAIEPFADLLDDWLAGPAANSPPFSPEYIAFTCMRMAADGC